MVIHSLSLNKHSNVNANGINPKGSHTKSQNKKSSPLPNNCLQYVFTFLSLHDLGIAAGVCKYWNEIQKTNFVWICFIDKYHLNISESAMKGSCDIKSIFKSSIILEKDTFWMNQISHLIKIKQFQYEFKYSDPDIFVEILNCFPTNHYIEFHERDMINPKHNDYLPIWKIYFFYLDENKKLRIDSFSEDKKLLIRAIPQNFTRIKVSFLSKPITKKASSCLII